MLYLLHLTAAASLLLLDAEALTIVWQWPTVLSTVTGCTAVKPEAMGLPIEPGRGGGCAARVCVQVHCV